MRQWAWCRLRQEWRQFCKIRRNHQIPPEKTDKNVKVNFSKCIDRKITMWYNRIMREAIGRLLLSAPYAQNPVRHHLKADLKTQNHHRKSAQQGTWGKETSRRNHHRFPLRSLSRRYNNSLCVPPNGITSFKTSITEKPGKTKKLTLFSAQ